MIQTKITDLLSKVIPSTHYISDNQENAETVSPSITKTDYSITGYHLCIRTKPDQLLEIVRVLDKTSFFLESITGVDWIKDEQMEVMYDFSRYDMELCRVVIKVKTPRNKPYLPSITEIYAGANWHERETHDFFGITFENHPNLIPLLLPEDADFHPLLKDYKNE